MLMSWNPMQLPWFLLMLNSNKIQLIHFTIFAGGICFRNCRRAIFVDNLNRFVTYYFEEKVYLHIASELIDTESTFAVAVLIHRKHEHILLYRPYHIVLWLDHKRRTWSSRVQVMVCRLIRHSCETGLSPTRPCNVVCIWDNRSKFCFLTEVSLHQLLRRPYQ